MRKTRWFKILIGFAGLTALAPVFCAETSGPEGGIQSTWGLERITPIVADEKNVNIAIERWTLEGFENVLVGNHRTASVTRTGPNARIRALVPVAGTFHPAFILYDTRGPERVAVFLDGVQVGAVTADWDSNRERLFFLTGARAFKGGETIELRALDAEGTYRIETLLLLRTKPAPRPYAYVFSEVGAQPEERQASVAWITSWPATCTVEWTADGGGAPSKAVCSVRLA